MSGNVKKGNLKTGPWIVLGLAVIFTVFGGGGLWATYASISGAIVASGTITVESKVKIVQHLEGGIVEQIFVRNGDEVKVGDPLLRLGDVSLKANLNIVSNNLIELLARQARLEAELAGNERISFPQELIGTESGALTQQIMDSKTALFKARREARIGQKTMMRQQIVQMGEQIQGLNAQMQSRIDQAEILEGSIERKQSAVDDGIVSLDSMDQLLQQLTQFAGDTGALRSQIAEVNSTIAQTELQIFQIDIDLRENVQAELRTVSSELSSLREQKIAYEDRLFRTLVVAPVSGLVHSLTINTVGGIVPPGGPIMQIIPGSDRLIIEARISVTDIDQITFGQEANVVLSAFDMRTTPTLSARVLNISAAQVVDEQSNIPYFVVDVEIVEGELSKLTQEQVLLPGMPAEIYIRTGERSPLDYLLKPLSDQIMRAFREN